MCWTKKKTARLFAEIGGPFLHYEIDSLLCRVRHFPKPWRSLYNCVCLMKRTLLLKPRSLGTNPIFHWPCHLLPRFLHVKTPSVKSWYKNLPGSPKQLPYIIANWLKRTSARLPYKAVACCGLVFGGSSAARFKCRSRFPQAFYQLWNCIAHRTHPFLLSYCTKAIYNYLLPIPL